MSKRTEMINSFYQRFDEDVRLTNRRQGQLEYITTMDYIHRHAPKNAKVLEIGAGTGRYSIALANEGFDVTAVELVESNLAVLKKNGAGLTNLEAYQGDALDLSRFADETFDVTLVFGPMYHLYEENDVHQALDEAIRVTKKDGIIFVAFLSVYAIMITNYFCEGLIDGIEMNFTEDYEVKHFVEQMFTGYDIEEFEALFAKKGVSHLSTVAVDSILEALEVRPDFNMPDAAFEALVKFHLATCEKRELLGTSSHLLYICKRR